MSGDGIGPPGAASAEELERENRRLQRSLTRLEDNVARLENFQDSNSMLLSRLLRELEEERAKSNRLLRNVLPQRVIDRLAAGETLIADRHPAVSVLFGDFVGFTGISASLAPATLIQELSRLFTAFDAICDEVGIEKIKTVGDAYLAIGGLAGEPEHAAAAAEAALQMIDYIEANPGTVAPWRVRIGLHEGPVVAGVIGATKFAYDVWGDTVNVAARLEASSEPNRIHVSGTFAEALTGRFQFESRGERQLKGKGSVATSFLTGRLPARVS